ncbi:MAG: insulinase family protein [Kiritimatiellae bacterium]|nr:insulinase family protein [Kiritimatiellia bacterium]
MRYNLMGNCRVTTLPNGLAVVTSPIEQSQCVAMGIFVATGGRYETAAQSGSSHFLEHMLFKGTKRRSALEITQAIEGRGGAMNAYTGADDTCFFLRMPHEYLKLGVDILSDMYLDAVIDPVEFARERDVILEEIKMYDDQPSQVCQEAFEKLVFKNHPLGAPLSGSEKTLMPMTAETLLAYKRSHYVPGATVFAFSGHVEHEACVDAVAKLLGDMPAAPVPTFRKVTGKTPIGRVSVIRREVAQTQSVFGFRMFGWREDPYRRAVAYVLRCLLGDNMSSRLFQKVRERRGLCYSISAVTQLFEETGFIAFPTGTDSRKTASALRLIAEELRRVKVKRVGPSELKRAKEYLIGGARLSLESPMSQLIRVGEHYLYNRALPDIQRRLDDYARVTAEDVQAMANELFNPDRLALSLVVPKEQPESEAQWLETLKGI